MSTDLKLASPGPRSLVGQRLSQAAVVVNASKFSEAHLARFRTQVEAAFTVRGWSDPLWLPTTAESRGVDQARAAVAAGVDLVLVAGGDGTTRTVGQELAGTGVPLALLPSGTGNLLARNLGIPRGDISAAVRVACEGEDRAVDVGWVEMDDAVHSAPSRVAFLVMAGAGFDAAIMAGADERMKSTLGPTAYLLAATRVLRDRMPQSTVLLDGVEVHSRASRGVIVGNCGSLTMGLSLMPDADPTDGMLDGILLLPRTLSDWASVFWSVVTRNRRTHRLMPRLLGRSMELCSDVAQRVEVDGDVVGEARRVRFTIQRSGLLIRCAARFRP
jgi:diacylglycerol kinase (ATP)